MRKIICNTSNKHATTLISHHVLHEMMGYTIPIKQCSRTVGEVFKDHYGREYQVQRNKSIRRI